MNVQVRRTLLKTAREGWEGYRDATHSNEGEVALSKMIIVEIDEMLLELSEGTV